MSAQASAAPRHGHGHHGHGAPAPMEPSGEHARAVVFEAPGQLALRDVSLRTVAPDEVVVATRYSSISAGTERLLFGGKMPGFPMLQFPLVPGYEAAGVVVSAGPAVTNVRPGDEVFVGGSRCYTDAFAVFGGQSAVLVKAASQVVPLQGIPLAAAPLLALAATALHGVDRLGDVAGKRIGVLGLGAIGQLAARFLVARGAHVVAGDVRPERLDPSLGVELADLSTTAFDAALADADAVVEASGRPEELAVCARALRPGGTILMLSYYDRIDTPYPDLFVKEATLLVAREWSHPDLLAARDALAAGTIALGRLADHVVPIDAYDRAYRTAFDDPSVFKVILAWA